jgi:hypothetical protein
MNSKARKTGIGKPKDIEQTKSVQSYIHISIRITDIQLMSKILTNEKSVK